MTVQSMITVVASIARDRIVDARDRIGLLGNPADALEGEIAPAGEQPFLHFASFHAIEGSDGKSGFLVLEFSADGPPAGGIRQLAERLGGRLTPIFKLAEDWHDGDTITGFLMRHRVEIGHRLTDTVGLAFCGTPGQSVAAIRREAELARKVAKLLSDQPPGLSPLGRLHEVREALAGDADAEWALKAPAPPLSAPASEASTAAKIGALAGPFFTTYAWPLLLVLVPLAGWILWPEFGLGRPDSSMSWLGWLHLAVNWLWFAAKAVVLALLALVALLGLAYLAFRRAEDSDWLSDRAPGAAQLAAIFERENAAGHVQNHMVSHTVLKPGLLRKLTIRLAFWAITRLTALNPRPGHLGEIGTIHFARWINIPGTRDLLFFSNYGGSWESYLEDFITKAHQGLTAVWSNTVGFPRTRNLFFDGATDGERFKRYARQSMIYTPFWYSAYPELTTANIRANALICRGLAAAMTEDEAVRWLALFGSTPRPLEKLETTQIQSIIFGGLGFKPHGQLVIVSLSKKGRNASWLAQLLPFIAFNDGRYAREPAILTLAATASGLAKLGLPQSGLDSFPAAFLGGMCGAGRDRILGDILENAPEKWRWGRSEHDVALLVYGNDEPAVAALRDAVDAICRDHQAKISYEVPLTPVNQSDSEREPFGFVDGVSQPAMRGTYRGLRNGDPIHLVEPGEFVLGYPDNRGNVPPGPLLDASHDPGLKLPIAGKDQGFSQCIAENPRMIGHNGSFLVIRQLEQHVDRFRDYCAAEAERLAPFVAHLPVEHEPDPATGLHPLTEYVGAKLIGRWKDGSSLVRYPYMSASRLKQLLGKDRSAAVGRPQANPPNPAAPPVPAANLAAQAAPAQTSGQPIRPDNDFLFGTEDPQGQRCPYGAHIRRANPRDSLDPGSDDQIAIANRHRILRVGRGYQEGDNKCAGLMFMCLAGDIERQFEFIQQTWMGSTKFHGLDAETDPIVSDGQPGRCSFTVPTRAGPVALNPMPQFVTMRGGGYYFLPGKQLLRWLVARQ